MLPQSFAQSNSLSFPSTTIDSPLQIRLINFLGLQTYLMDKFIFKRKPSTYKLRNEHGTLKLLLPHHYKPPVRYHLHLGIIQFKNHSIPYVKLTPRNRKNQYYDTIVYAHGNSSDMSDALSFMERMALIYQAEYLIFDYTGYGQSKQTQVGQDIIAKDIEIVLAWLNKPLNQIILWGFSLGSFPVLSAAAKYPVKGVILQCPIASVSCFFTENLSPSSNLKQDFFSNLNLITSVKSKIFMVHSHADEVIPIKHVQLLFDKYISVNNPGNIFFIQVMKLPHNGIHKYIVSQKSNDLQRELLLFLNQLKIDETIGFKGLDEKLAQIHCQIKQAQFEQNSEEDDEYQIVDGPAKNIRMTKNKINTDCFCFSTCVSPKNQFRSN